MKVHGVGPCPADIAIIGPHPSRRDDETGIPFSPGRGNWTTGGDELNHQLEAIGLSRDDIWLDNLYQDYKGKDYVYSTEEYALAAPALLERLKKVSPWLIVAMGREVARLFLGDIDITDVESLAWHDPNVPGRVILPQVHIVAGMRNSELSPFVVKGFQALQEYLQGTLLPRKLWDDPYPNPMYRLLTGDEVWDILEAL